MGQSPGRVGARTLPTRKGRPRSGADAAVRDAIIHRDWAGSWSLQSQGAPGVGHPPCSPCLDDADAQFGELAHHVLDLLGLLLKRCMNWKPIRLSVTSV